MIDALLVFAVLCACFGAFWRGEDGRLVLNIPALALLASVAATSAFVWLGVPFDWRLWGAIDLAVIGAILVSRMTATDWLILPLFIPAWISYGEPDAFAHGLTTLAVSAQLLLTFPAANVWKRIKQKRHEQPDIWDDYDLRAIHEPGG